MSIPKQETPVVLIVDDETFVAETTARVLATTFTNAEIVIATTPEEGIEVITNRTVAILISDLSMPLIDGIEVISKAFHKDSRTVSILITGRATKESVIRGVNEANLWKVLEKPWRMEQLIALVQEAFSVYNDRAAPETQVAEEAAVAPEGGPKGRTMPRHHKTGAQHPRHILIPKRAEHQRATPMRLHHKGMKIRQKTATKPLSVDNSTKVDERYKNLTLLNEGGTGAVYKADDTLLGMQVAIKIISEEYASNAEGMLTLFNEARTAMQLSHKHIVRLHNVHESRGVYYLVMEFIDGSTMRVVLEQSGSLPPATVMQLVEICDDALGYAHRHQVYHRDLKPENLMLASDGVVKIIDFGIACLAIQVMKEREDTYGTPFYMSPEEMAGEALDQRTDIYSLGIMIHEFLTGNVPPHDGTCAMTDFYMYRPSADETLPPLMRRVLQRSFARLPSDRHPSVGEFAADFRNAYNVSYPQPIE